MANLDFGDSDEEALIVLKGFAHRVNNDLYNSGRDGLLTRFNSFLIEHETREDEQDKRHKANTNRLNVIIALLTLLLGFVGVIRGCNIPAVKTLLDPAKVFHSQNPTRDTAQTVNLPPTYITR